MDHRDSYDPHRIEPKWQAVWEREETYRAGGEDDPRPRFYALDMFPYPSGDLHMGHAEVFAIGDRCSHAEASLAEGEVFDHEVECPRHGSEFDLRTGKALSLPATRPVPTYQVSVEDGVVYLDWEPS